MVVNVLTPQKTITTAKGAKGEMVIVTEIVGDKMVSVLFFFNYLFKYQIEFVFKEKILILLRLRNELVARIQLK